MLDLMATSYDSNSSTTINEDQMRRGSKFRKSDATESRRRVSSPESQKTHESVAEWILARANDNCVKAQTFDKSGSDNHCHLDRGRGVRLTSNRLNCTLAQKTDA
jgi:hypothetical protein